MKYVVLMNMQYMNSFRTYSEACDLRDKLERDFPNNIIDEVEKAIEGKNCTFTAFVVEAVRIALENIKDEE